MTPAARADRAAPISSRSLRPSVLDTVAREYDLLAPQLGADGRQKLDAHRELVRELEPSLGAIGPAPKCDTTFDGTPATTSATRCGSSCASFASRSRATSRPNCLLHPICLVHPIPHQARG